MNIFIRSKFPMKFQLLKFPVSMPCSLQNRDSWPHMLALGRTHNCPPERVCILGTPTHWGASRSVGDRKRSISGSKLDFKSSGHFSPCTANCLQFPWLLARLSSQHLESENNTWEKAVWEKAGFKHLLQMCSMVPLAWERATFL